MSSANYDSYKSKALPTGNDGLIKEDVMDQIFDVSPIDRPFCDAIGKGTSSNTLKEWLRESLATPNADNAIVEGADASGDDTITGERFSNAHQLMSKTVKVSDRLRDVDTVGSSDELVRQIMINQKSLKRDEEAALTSSNAAVIGDTSTASKMAGVGAWIGVPIDGSASTTTDRGIGGADPVTNGTEGAGGTPVTASTAGTPRALSEASVRAMMAAAYLNGGNPELAISTPAVIEKFSSYLFSASARVATLQSDVSQSNRTGAGAGNGATSGGVAAQGSVNIFVTDFGTLTLTPDRFMPAKEAGNDSLYLIDPTTWEATYLSGYRTIDLAKTGTATNRQITVDVSLVCTNPEANAGVFDIDATTAMVA